jgi:autotransporter-associated beta strand protein
MARVATLIASLVAIAIMLAPAPLRAANYTWSVPAGDWSIASNWGGTAPTNVDTAYVFNGGTATVTQLGETCLILSLGSSAGSGTVQMTAGALDATGDEFVGDSGIGSFTLSAGTNSVSAGGALYVGNTAGSSGTYNLSGSGLLSAPTEYIGYSGAGSFTQSGGTNTVTSTLELGYTSSGSGTYNLNGGLLTLSASGMTQGAGTGAFNLGGGTLGGSAAWSSSLNVNMTGVAPGTFNTSGGNISLSGNLSGGGGLTASGTGILTLTGLNTYSGSTTVDGGTLQLAGGRLSSPIQTVGFSSIGAFAQSGGTNTVTEGLVLGEISGSSGIYALSGGSLLAGSENIGLLGSGSFTQSGGTNTLSATLELGVYATANGTYNLNGGLLTLPATGITQGAGTGAFNFGGGTLGASFPAWSSTVSMNLTGSGGNATINTAGGGISLSGNLSGAGGLTKFGVNTLTLSGSNTYLGNTTISGPLSMTAGQLSSPILNVGYSGAGSFTQSGGTNSVSNTLYLGYSSSGAYTLSAGSLSAANVYLGYSGTGSFTQSGGTNSVSNILELGYNAGDSGTYTLNGGLLLLSVSGATQGAGSATFNFGGGTLAATSPWASSLNINMTGAVGPGTVNTTGGNISLAGNLSGAGGLDAFGTGILTLSGSNTYSGTSTVDGGTLQLAGGRLSSRTQIVGFSLLGVFAQSGGTNTRPPRLCTWATISEATVPMPSAAVPCLPRISTSATPAAAASRSPAGPMHSPALWNWASMPLPTEPTTLTAAC